MDYKAIMLNVDELWLKGRNRSYYYRKLKEHIDRLVSSYTKNIFTVRNEEQRLLLESKESFPDALLDRLMLLPGISTMIPCYRVKSDIETIFESLVSQVETLGTTPTTFKVITRRTNKKFPMSSYEISALLGEKLLDRFSHLKVDVHRPQLILDVKILPSDTYTSCKKIVGIGGLPVETSGFAVTLLSGGFDSPVASYLMSKRGCRQIFTFFHAYPYVGDEVLEKIKQLASVLARYQKGTELYIVPFGEIQTKIAQNCQEDYRTLLFRHYMLQCADLLAKKLGAKALITGDSLGQVSSQTMENISILDKNCDSLIFRPLIGLNKSEILSISKLIDTHDISVVPHDDACSLFSPKHPIIRADKFYFKQFLSSIDLTEDLQKAVEEAKKMKFSVSGDLI